MGTAVATIWYVDVDDPVAVLRTHPRTDPGAAQALAQRLHPDAVLEHVEGGALAHHPSPPEAQVYVGAFPGLAVVSSRDIVCATPSDLPADWITPAATAHTYLVALHSDSHWGCFAHWEHGRLRRAFSAGPCDIRENLGLPLPFEGSYWAGEHPQFHEGQPTPLQALPFHPAEFADAANREWLGFDHAAGDREGSAVDAADIPVLGFAVHPAGYQLPAGANAAFTRPANARRSPSLSRWFRRRSA